MDKQEYQYQIRAHHGMCLVFFKGNGYSSGFTKHMGNVKYALEKNPMIKVLTDEDDICKAVSYTHLKVKSKLSGLHQGFKQCEG